MWMMLMMVKSGWGSRNGRGDAWMVLSSAHYDSISKLPLVWLPKYHHPALPSHIHSIKHTHKSVPCIHYQYLRLQTQGKASSDLNPQGSRIGRAGTTTKQITRGLDRTVAKDYLSQQGCMSSSWWRLWGSRLALLRCQGYNKLMQVSYTLSRATTTNYDPPSLLNHATPRTPNPRTRVVLIIIKD